MADVGPDHQTRRIFPRQPRIDTINGNSPLTGWSSFTRPITPRCAVAEAWRSLSAADMPASSTAQADHQRHSDLPVSDHFKFTALSPDGHDEINTADGNDDLNGGGGNDILRSGGGKDRIDGGMAMTAGAQISETSRKRS